MVARVEVVVCSCQKTNYNLKHALGFPINHTIVYQRTSGVVDL